MDTVVEKMTNERTAVIKNLFNTAYHVARIKSPLRHYKPLCELQEKNGVCMAGYYGNDKACKIFIDNISDTERVGVGEDVGRALWVSVMADGSTDPSITEQENVYVRYVNETKCTLTVERQSVCTQPRRRPHRRKCERRTCVTLLIGSLPSLRRNSSF